MPDPLSLEGLQARWNKEADELAACGLAVGAEALRQKAAALQPFIAREQEQQQEIERLRAEVATLTARAEEAERKVSSLRLQCDAHQRDQLRLADHVTALIGDMRSNEVAWREAYPNGSGSRSAKVNFANWTAHWIARLTQPVQETEK